ncbi:MAG: peptide ABC transporter ATP-binding protein [Candidatus Infernicultor aquiphilus]|uniref:Peptide ABC transporter ATP-binding protein n=1 Tax=Candidatus Infernicultor aquiphilus TaxID=1805029 RepID=A0A2M7K828_9BACT|nr:MAG: peptide ABC transporter ATP-binding protein [Candidatus Atribacteria bacterium CG_4_8_14_3_um_filter_34_18]PIY31797.1 MAG: peptide ABC transporter ATP-binding protein [Candidatus Atribacteria bacterium CG_4_10_14_3_um_filter_34_13]
MQKVRGDLLNISKLKVVFYTYRGIIKALNGVELWMNKGERLGIVGETGCGKSVTALSIMGLIEQPGEIMEGDILFGDKLLTSMQETSLINIRGKEISMIFQEPNAALNPVMKVGFQIAESISKVKNKKIGKEVYVEVRRMLEIAGLDWERTINLYPHELSGGMAQRVMIAMALSSNPKLLIADEPTSALDVTIQAQILELLDELVKKFGNAVILITHNMGVAAEFCDKMAVMYAGNMVEYARTTNIFENPHHPYTRGLLKAVPKIGRTDELQSIPGIVPDLVNPPSGCRFHPRCKHAMDICRKDFPPLVEIKSDHYVACYLYGKEDIQNANS